MKNKIKYFILYPLVILLIISAVTNVNLIALGTKVIFGASYWKDSLSNGISTNKSIYLGTGDSLYYNGVVVTSGSGGGGDVVKANENVFTNYNFFQNGTYFTDSLNVSGAIVIMDSLKISDGITWGGTSSIRTELDNLLFKSIGYQFLTQHGTQTATLDSVNGFHLYYGVYTGDGSGLTALNASNLSSGTVPYARSGIDSATHLYTNRSDTITGILNFNVIPTVASFFQNIARTIQYWLPNSLSDTLVALNQTQTITNKTISGSSNTITNLRRSIVTYTAPIFSMAANSTYYFGSVEASVPEATVTTRLVYFPVACTIKAATFASRNGTGADNGAGDDTTSVRIRLNNTTDYYVTVGGFYLDASGGWDVVTHTGLNIAIGAGEFIEFKIVTPSSWSSGTTNSRIHMTLSIE